MPIRIRYTQVELTIEKIGRHWYWSVDETGEMERNYEGRSSSFKAAMNAVSERMLTLMED